MTCVVGAIDLTHSTRAERGVYRVGTQSSTWLQHAIVAIISCRHREFLRGSMLSCRLPFD